MCNAWVYRMIKVEKRQNMMYIRPREGHLVYTAHNDILHGFDIPFFRFVFFGTDICGREAAQDQKRLMKALP